MKIIWLREHFCWMGKHSGYDQLCSVIKRDYPQNKYYSVWRDADKKPFPGSRRILRKLFIPQKGSPFYDLHSAAADLRLLIKAVLTRPDIIHITYIENNLGKIIDWKKQYGFKVIGTAHQPISWWRLRHRYPESISELDALIVPSRREVDYFAEYLPNRVSCIPHGIDTGFFKPAKKSESILRPPAKIRCIYAGKWLRDHRTMAEIVDNVLSERPDIRFEMIVPEDACQNISMYRIARHDQVEWHSELSDEQLRTVYRKASIMVLPLLDSTANNTILEAMSCGLPIVSNDTGGLRDYTSSRFTDLLPIGDVDGMVGAILNLAKDPQLRRKRGAAARLHVMQNFSWDKIADQTLEIYNEVFKSSR